MASFTPPNAPPVTTSGATFDCDLSIIIVSWNVWPILAGCLRSIEHASRPIPGQPSLRHFGPAGMPAALEVIVVDNASSDATQGELPQAFPWVRFIASTENLGFTRGNNLGYASSRGRYVYFLNPDTELDQGHTHRLAAARGLPPPHDSLWVLYAAIAAAPGIGMVGPQLRYPDGEQQGKRAPLSVAARPAFSRAHGWGDPGAAIRGRGACTWRTGRSSTATTSIG